MKPAVITSSLSLSRQDSQKSANALENLDISDVFDNMNPDQNQYMHAFNDEFNYNNGGGQNELDSR